MSLASCCETLACILSTLVDGVPTIAVHVDITISITITLTANVIDTTVMTDVILQTFAVLREGSLVGKPLVANTATNMIDVQVCMEGLQAVENHTAKTTIFASAMVGIVLVQFRVVFKQLATVPAAAVVRCDVIDDCIVVLAELEAKRALLMLFPVMVQPSANIAEELSASFTPKVFVRGLKMGHECFAVSEFLAAPSAPEVVILIHMALAAIGVVDDARAIGTVVLLVFHHSLLAQESRVATIAMSMIVQ
ncbi:hypothetical protein TI39_contig685g00001 [Zymoseptoria brevis]|uniref:Uncharacterized protein n=1 Tax=Zymoseptoria brevis TaxID=1047168 RepID=A0A0F4GGW4_9PEZI|nr:hypothetical protein TI39_contig685g00001 [Zymoseptoria brevis]